MLTISDTKNSTRCKKKFLRFFPGGFDDNKYVAWERDYKWQAHLQWQEMLNKRSYQSLLLNKKYAEIAGMAVRIETKTNLLFSFEKMALRDAVKSRKGAETFALGLYDYVYGKKDMPARFNEFAAALTI